MKLFNKYTIWAFCGITMAFSTSCSDLGTEPAGSTLSDQQLKDVINEDASKLSSEVTGLYSNMIEEGAIKAWMGRTRDYDFGYAGSMMIYDASGQDEVSQNSGYNWFLDPLQFKDRTAPSEYTYFLWNQFYKNIKASNDVIKAVDPNTTDATAKSYRGQAFAMRAFCYLNLIQAYQFTYKGHETALGVPIVTDSTTEAQANNNPRATVKAVYDLIISDLTKSISDLKGFNRSGKDIIDQHVAYGLRARANLLMQNWSEAASDATLAADGFEPLSMTDAAAPGFNDINASNWIWGNDVVESNDIVQSGIVNFPSMMCSFGGNGYSPTYASRLINSKLWNEIPTTDVRKGWWFDSNLQTPIVDKKRCVFTTDKDGNSYVQVLNAAGDEVADIVKPYTNAKFGAYKNDYGNETNACDIPLMRVEEMILIKAEATAMAGNPTEGAKILQDFVQTYRDPKYTCTATTAEGVQDAVWFQRRVELWGEGFSFFDLLRLKKPLDRTGANYEKTMAFSLTPESQIMLWIIPEDEVNHNTALVGKNNPIATVPTAK